MKKKLRRWTRAIHRDLGYLSVGLTFVYAISGLAVNHIADWEPSQTIARGETKLQLGADANPLEVAELASNRVLGPDSPIDPDSVYEQSGWIEFQAEATRFQVNRASGEVQWEREEPRFFLKTANWLHLNRGKAAWTYIADTYAIALLLLACSGLWMLPGKKGLFGRGIVLVVLGAAVPVAYVHFSDRAEGSARR